MNIAAMEHSDTEPGIYALYAWDRCLYLHETATGRNRRVARLPGISVLPVKLYYHHPYICVSERFGLNSAVVNIATGAVRNFAREDYHCDVSSFSLGFLERGGRVELIHQSCWNRLDVTDLETGELLTGREVRVREVEPGSRDENGIPLVPAKYEYRHYLDYFHSLLHVSPNYKNFLSNGWAWAPVDYIRCFSVEAFFKDYEPGSVGVDYGHGYNWDRPCAFIDDDVFVMAADDMSCERDEEELRDYRYRQLRFYRLSDKDPDEKWLPSFKQAECGVFPTDPVYGELSGALWYDAGLGGLVALSESGAYILDLDGRVLWQDPGITCAEREAASKRYNGERRVLGCQYSPERHLFYCYDNGTGKVIEKTAK